MSVIPIIQPWLLGVFDSLGYGIINGYETDIYDTELV